MADTYVNLSGVQRLWAKIKAYIDGKTAQATSTALGTIKLNPNEHIDVNSDGQLTVEGRLGQSHTTTGVYAPATIEPGSVGNGSFLLTEASGTKLGNKSLAVSTGSSITLKTAAAAGATQYVVQNTYENRIICAAAVDGVAALNESSAATSYANITSVQISNAPFTPDSSANSSNNIVIKTDKSINPSSSTTTIRVYANEGTGFSNLFVGQQVGGVGGASVVVGQKVYSASGNACALVGASLYNTGNGNAVFGRQHISRKNRSFLAGTGHDTTNAPSEGVAALGQWSDISSTTAFAIGNGTSHTARANALHLDTSGNFAVSGTITDGAGNVLGGSGLDGITVLDASENQRIPFTVFYQTYQDAQQYATEYPDPSRLFFIRNGSLQITNITTSSGWYSGTSIETSLFSTLINSNDEFFVRCHDLGVVVPCNQPTGQVQTSLVSMGDMQSIILGLDALL